LFVLLPQAVMPQRIGKNSEHQQNDGLRQRMIKKYTAEIVGCRADCLRLYKTLFGNTAQY
jgi:hypothetical protein